MKKVPVDLTEAFKESPPPAPGPAAPIPAAAAKGIDLAQAFKEQEAPPAKPLSERVAEKGRMLYRGSGLESWINEINNQAKEYKDALTKDVKSQPEGFADQALAGWRTLMHAGGFVLSPLTGTAYAGVVNPVNAAIRDLGGLIEKHAAADATSDQERRLAYIEDREPKQDLQSRLDWKVHKQDVRKAVENLQTVTEAAVNAGLMFAPGAERIPKIERQPALARVALNDMRAEIAAKLPDLKPVTAALDHQMGFQQIRETVGKELSALPPGSTRSAASILDSMLPHAEGYAKSFLQKLGDAVDPVMPVKFKEVAGQSASNLGVYNAVSNSIEVATSRLGIIHTTLHEMVHGATVRILDTLVDQDLAAEEAQLGRGLSEAEKIKIVNNPRAPLLKELDELVREAQVRAGKAGVDFYGLHFGFEHVKRMESTGDRAFLRQSPRYEFIAEVFTNPRLQEFLANSEKYASLKYKAKNLLDELGYLIGKHLGMNSPHEADLLQRSLRIGGQLMKMQGEGQAKKGQDIYDVVMARTPEGETITRNDVKFASRPEIAMRKPEGVKKTQTALAISVEQILRAVAPEALGERAKLAGAVVASRISEQMQKAAAWQTGSKTMLKFWRARPDLSGEFIGKFEKGEKFSDPVLQDAAARYKAWAGRIYDQDKGITGLEYEPRENYLYHVFEDSEGVANYFNQKYGSKWGDPKFIKERGLELYEQAVKAGFVPRFNNPEDIMLARQHASDVAQMHSEILSDLEKYGLATLKVKGGEKLSKTVEDGQMTFEVEKVEGNKQPENTTRWRAPNGKVYWVDNQSQVILQNAFKSKSLWEDKSLGGATFRGAMALKNALVPIRLAVSLFHPLHVVGIDIAASWTRAASGLLSGTTGPVKALGQVLKSGFGPIYENPKMGWRVLQAWRGKIPTEALTEADAESLHLMVEGGMIPEMSSQFRTNSRQSFMNALRDAQAGFRTRRAALASGGAAKAVWHAPWALLSAMQKPIFEEWIPSLKAASYLKDVKGLLERNPQLSENDAQRQLAFRKIAKSVDNRYGEMAYNTLFWKRWIKDVAVLNTLSLGWQLGFLREYGGGAIDLGQFAAGSGKLQRIKAGQLDRPLFVAAYTTLGAATAGLMTWGMTGEYPQDLLDWVSPRTGETDVSGKSQRVSTMFYSREFASIYKHMQNQGVVGGLSQAVTNKGSGLFGLMHEWATGVDGFGKEIRDPDGDAFSKVEETLAYTLADLEPISIKSMQEQPKDAQTKGAVLSVLGFTPAPKYLTESATEGRILEEYKRYVAPVQTPFDRAEYSAEFSKLRKAYETGDAKTGDLLDAISEKFDLSGADQRRIMRTLNSDVPTSIRLFMRLPWGEQKKVLDKATVEEREELLPHSNREHLRGKYEAPK